MKVICKLKKKKIELKKENKSYNHYKKKIDS